MTKEIEWDYNLVGRCTVTGNWFAAALIHGGLSRGTYPGVYTNEAIGLKHDQGASFMGVGAGCPHPVDDHLHAYAQLLGGWGIIKMTGNPKQKIVTEIEGHEFKGFSAVGVLGIDYYLPSSGVWSADAMVHYIDGHVMPSISLKYGINFDLQWRHDSQHVHNNPFSDWLYSFGAMLVYSSFLFMLWRRVA